MIERLSLKFIWLLVPLFWTVTLLGVQFNQDVPKLNLFCGLALLFFLNLTNINENKKGCFWLIIASLFIFSFFVSAHDYGVLIFALACGGIFLLSHTQSSSYITLLIIALGAFSNLSFVTNTNIQEVQYDFLSCYNYIEYIQENHLKFWQENPILTRPGYSAYHPILHYLIAASIISGSKLIGASHIAANEAFQVVLVGYMLWYYVLSARIFELLKLPRAVMFALLSFICLFPSYNAIAGLINNDCLLLPLQAGTVYYALLYYLHGQKKNLFWIWLFMTAACLTKLSGILTLPMVAVALLGRLIKEKKIKIFYDLCGFSVLLLLGISLWPLYQHYHLHINADFVPPQEHLTLTPFSFWQRFSPLKAFIYEQMFYDDYGPNFWETLTKTALFGQWTFAGRGIEIMTLIRFMILGYKLFNAMIIIAVIYLLCQYKDKQILLIILSLLLALLGGLLAFSLKHPYMCNQDFRYIAILPLSYALIFGLFIPQLPKIGQRFLISLLIGFGFLACFIWFWVSR